MKCLLSAVLLLVAVLASSQAPIEEQTRSSGFDEQWLKSVVSIELKFEEFEENAPESIGTGFLVMSPNGHTMLFTAAHVVRDEMGGVRQGLAYRFNSRVASHSSLIRDKWQDDDGFGSWFISEEHDIACRFVYPPSSADILALTRSRFLSMDTLQVGAPLLILGFPLGLRSLEYANPIVRSAMVARIDDDGVLVDGFVFPGNSGGPVVYFPPGELIGIGRWKNVSQQMLVGVVKQQLTYQDTAFSRQTGRPRVTFTENTGLTYIEPVTHVSDLMNRADVVEFDSQLEEQLSN